MSATRPLVMGALLVGGALVLFAGLTGGRGALGELVILLAVLAGTFLAARALWRWLRDRQEQLASWGLLAAFAVAAAGWLLVALVRAFARVSPDNFGMIVVWPLVYLVCIPVLCAGVLATAVAAGVVFIALRRRLARRALVALGGVVAGLLNLIAVVVLTRLMLTG